MSSASDRLAEKALTDLTQAVAGLQTDTILQRHTMQRQIASLQEEVAILRSCRSRRRAEVHVLREEVVTMQRDVIDLQRLSVEETEAIETVHAELVVLNDRFVRRT